MEEERKLKKEARCGITNERMEGGEKRSRIGRRK